MLNEVSGMDELKGKTNGLNKKFIMGFFGNYSSKSAAAEETFRKFSLEHMADDFFIVDTVKVRDIHSVFGVDSVPSAVVVNSGKVERRIYGAFNKSELESLFKDPGSFFNASAGSNERPAVTVYSTQSCPWCVRVKNYLREKNIRFSDVDVAANAKAAEMLMKKTGQTGVPQIKIGGAFVVGFDKKKIDQLLGI
jgi:glutaredoxin-like YruB-family protein